MIVKLLSSNSYRKMQSLLLKGTPATKCLFGTINFSAFTPVCLHFLLQSFYKAQQNKRFSAWNTQFKVHIGPFYLIGGLQPYNFACLRWWITFFKKQQDVEQQRANYSRTIISWIHGLTYANKQPSGIKPVSAHWF